MVEVENTKFYVIFWLALILWVSGLYEDSIVCDLKVVCGQWLYW